MARGAGSLNDARESGRSDQDDRKKRRTKDDESRGHEAEDGAKKPKDDDEPVAQIRWKPAHHERLFPLFRRAWQEHLVLRVSTSESDFDARQKEWEERAILLTQRVRELRECQRRVEQQRRAVGEMLRPALGENGQLCFGSPSQPVSLCRTVPCSRDASGGFRWALAVAFAFAGIVLHADSLICGALLFPLASDLLILFCCCCVALFRDCRSRLHPLSLPASISL
jgi:hypothetical protein